MFGHLHQKTVGRMPMATSAFRKMAGFQSTPCGRLFWHARNVARYAGVMSVHYRSTDYLCGTTFVRIEQLRGSCGAG
jgi:hypothetical protein